MMQLKIDKPVCIDAVPLTAGVPKALSYWPPRWCRPYQRAVNVFSELSRSPSPDAKRDVMIASMGVMFRCVQVCGRDLNADAGVDVDVDVEMTLPAHGFPLDAH